MRLKKNSIISITFLLLILITAFQVQIKNVLIIGDSISIGYTPFVEKALAPDIIVSHNPGNGGSTLRGIERIEEWLENREWDLILFNFGLHDLVYKDEQNKYDVINGKITVPLELYEENLQVIINKLKETTAKLAFVTTTVVPENSPGRKSDDPEKYNEVAIKVMKKNGIEVIDLYSASLVIHPQNSEPGNVHYSKLGYELLASHIINSIKDILNLN